MSELTERLYKWALKISSIPENNSGRALYVALCEAEDDVQEAADELVAQEARIAALEKALAFYADVSKYPSPLTGGMGALWTDCGEIARSALTPSLPK